MAPRIGVLPPAGKVASPMMTGARPETIHADVMNRSHLWG
jgi:hypothetical protein